MARPSSILRWRVQSDEHYRAIRTLRSEHARQERRIWRELRLVALGLFALTAIAVIGRRWRETRHVPIAYLWVFAVPLLAVGIYAATRPLAKRQLTWLRGRPELRWLDPARDAAELEHAFRLFLAGAAPV